jgi:hypothetical protein
MSRSQRLKPQRHSQTHKQINRLNFRTIIQFKNPGRYTSLAYNIQTRTNPVKTKVSYILLDIAQ